jgi:tetratricopeptide (TPR) repeat protein
MAQVFPDSSNNWDSLGEAYMAAGDNPAAITCYERALEMIDRDKDVPPDQVEPRRVHAKRQLAELRKR